MTVSLDNFPLLLFFIVAVLLVVGAVEVGFRLGDAAHRRSQDEKESPVSAISGAILGLLAFILAFTFAIVSDRFDARKALVREEAVAIRTAYMRAEFLPEGDRAEAMRLLREYVDLRLAAVESRDLETINNSIFKSVEIQDNLWDMAVANARLDMNSDVAALYIEALNDIVSVHAQRVSVGLQARVPMGIWVVLLALLVIGMLAVGYQTAISGSRRSWAALILAISFSLVLAVIAALDRPQSALLPVSQQPLENVRTFMESGLENQ